MSELDLMHQKILLVIIFIKLFYKLILFEKKFSGIRDTLCTTDESIRLVEEIEFNDK